MKTDLLFEHASLHRMTRREACELTAKAGAVGALARLGVGAQSTSAARTPPKDDGFSDEMFDVDAVLCGAWDDTAFYRRGDQRGTLPGGDAEEDARRLEGARRAQAGRHLQPGQQRLSRVPEPPAAALRPAPPDPRLRTAAGLRGHPPVADSPGLQQDQRTRGATQRLQLPDRDAARQPQPHRCGAGLLRRPPWPRRSPRPGARTGSEASTRGRS